MYYLLIYNLLLEQLTLATEMASKVAFVKIRLKLFDTSFKIITFNYIYRNSITILSM